MPAPPAPWTAEDSSSDNSSSYSSSTDNENPEKPKNPEKVAEEVHEEPCAAAVPVPIAAPASMSAGEASHAGDRRGGSDPGAAWWNDRSNRGGANRGANREPRTANAAPWRPATNAAPRQRYDRDQCREDHRENYAGRSVREPTLGGFRGGFASQRG